MNYEQRIIELESMVSKLNLQLNGMDPVPEPNTISEWRRFGLIWLHNPERLQWYDTSPNADREWFDFEEDDCYYPYDEALVIRLKPEDKEATLDRQVDACNEVLGNFWSNLERAAKDAGEGWDDERIDIIGQNGNDGLHY